MRTLWPILVAFLLLHALYNWAIPLGEGPDEPGHLAYVLFLAEQGRLPVQLPGAEDVPGEGHQPPLAYLLAAPAVAWLPADQRTIMLTANPHFVWAGGDEPGAFMRGSHELWPWQGLPLAWHLVRLVAGLWGAATVALTFLAARLLRPGNPWLPPLAATLVALNPQFLFTTALATNDALLAALGAACLWWCLRPARSPLVWALVAGGLFGLALLTKQSALLLGPLLLWGGWQQSVAAHRAGPSRRTKDAGRRTKAGQDTPPPFAHPGRLAAVEDSASQAMSGESGIAARAAVKRFGGVTLAWGCTALAAAGWWYWRNLGLYGDLFGLGAFKAEFATQPFVWSDPAAWAGAFGQLFGSFWARFGWMSVAPPAWTIWLYGLLCALAAAGLLLRLTRRPVVLSGSPWIGPALALAMALVWTLAFAATAGLVAWQGRMLFPALAAIGLIVAAGLLGLSAHLTRLAPAKRAAGAARPLQSAPPGRPASDPLERSTKRSRAARAWQPARAGGLLACLCLAGLAVFMPLAVIRPAYTWVALAPGEAQAGLGNATYGRFAASWEQGVELRGWRLEEPARAGAELPVTLTWHSLEPVPRPWTVFIHLVAADETIVAKSNMQPRAGSLPFPLWTAGDWIADTHLLALPADLPPGAYRLRAGLYRPDKDGRRQDVWDEAGQQLGSYVELGVVSVRP